MLKHIFLCVAMLSMTGVRAQNDSIIPKNKRSFQYFGIQANLLLQQFISFNSNSSINTNPYIFSYAASNFSTGAGTSFGTGFNISDHHSNDGVSSISVKNVNLAFRVGYEKKYLQQQRFIPFWGIDIALGGTYNEVTSTLNQSITNNTVRVSTTRIFAGPAFRGGLLFALSKNVLLGTEFFFNAQVAYGETVNNGIFSSSIVPVNIGFQAPTGLYLMYRF